MSQLLRELLAAQTKLEQAKAIVEATTGVKAVAFMDLNKPGTIWVGWKDDLDYFKSEEGWNTLKVTSARFHEGPDGIVKHEVCDVRICGRSGLDEQSAAFKALGVENCGDPDEVSRLLSAQEAG